MDWIVAVISVGGALGGVWLGNQLSTQSSRSEKERDLRRSSYGEILSALNTVESILKTAEEYVSEDYMGYFDGPVSSHHDDAISERMGAARKRFSDDYLILSDEFIRLYEEMLNAFSTDPNDDRASGHFIFQDAIYKYRPKLLEVAKREAGLSRMQKARAPEQSAAAPRA